MRTLTTEILVLGGGATGTGLVRDLAMRGFKTILVEQNDLATGTTGRYHGLLHSGGRYVVKDPLAAKECIEENQILRRILPQCIEDTGGFFVLTPGDDPSYVDLFQAGCRQAGIPCDEIPISRMLKSEPLLNRRITRCFQVPDASADSFLAADMNAESARQYGALILRYHRVLRLLTGNSAASICGALCHDRVKDEEVRIEADLVVNATGAWAGKIAATAGIAVQMYPGKGIMMAVAHRVVNTVINRCKMPGDGDILVPAHTVAVIGTTDVKVSDPDRFGIETWEMKLMLDEGEKIIPGFRNLRFLRAWAGVRPLFQEAQPLQNEGGTVNRDITRAFVLLDHAVRDGVSGFLTITSGKWTTYRKMAEVTADKVCEKLAVQRPCRTHLEALPSVKHLKPSTEASEPDNQPSHYYSLGHRLAQIEADNAYGQLICECELATRNQVIHTMLGGNTHTLDDIRRDLRLGMGPCQAGFCTLRAAGLLYQVQSQPQGSEIEIAETTETQSVVESTNVAIRDFLQERWKGVRRILWGQQLRQERLNELIYLNVLSADKLPGPVASPLCPQPYEQEPAEPIRITEQANVALPPLPSEEHSSRQVDVLVIGAGLAGLTAAWQAALQGKKVKLIAKGWGATYWASGCIDVLGYDPASPDTQVTSPGDVLEKLIQTHPWHPYALAGLESIDLAMRSIQEFFNHAGYPLRGSLLENWLLPTALGTLRPTCLAPDTMVAGDGRNQEPMLIVGFEQFLDFYPGMAAANLTSLGIPSQAILLDLPTLKKRRFVNGMTLARLFDTPGFRAEVISAIKPQLNKAKRIGFPAVIGLNHSIEAWNDLETQLGRSVFEIPGLPPSIPGIRLHNHLTRAIRQAGGSIFDGMQAYRGYAQGDQLQAIATETGTNHIIHEAKTTVLATGGILGGGFCVAPPGSDENPLTETTLGLPIQVLFDHQNWFELNFLGAKGHAIFRSGIKTEKTFRPINHVNTAIFTNLFAIGSSLAGFDPVRERSLEGVAIATGFCVGRNRE